MFYVGKVSMDFDGDFSDSDEEDDDDDVCTPPSIDASWESLKSQSISMLSSTGKHAVYIVSCLPHHIPQKDG